MKLWIRWFVAVTAALGAVCALPLYFASPASQFSGLLGWLISFVACGSSGYLAFRYLSASHVAFLIVFFGGILARLAFVSIAVAASLMVAHVNVEPFFIGLFLSYAGYQTVEVATLGRIRIGRKTDLPNTSKGAEAPE